MNNIVFHIFFAIVFGDSPSIGIFVSLTYEIIKRTTDLPALVVTASPLVCLFSCGEYDLQFRAPIVYVYLTLTMILVDAQKVCSTNLCLFESKKPSLCIDD